MNINSKIESSKKIKELDLNKFPEQIFKIGEEEKINDFLQKNPADFYAIRDKNQLVEFLS